MPRDSPAPEQTVNRPNPTEYEHTHIVPRSSKIRAERGDDRYRRLVGELIDPAELVGAHEIAERLNVKRPQVIHSWRQRHEDFPEPVATLKTALIWDWSQIEAWARATGRLG